MNNIFRKFQDSKIVVASHNPGKVIEIKDLFKPFQIKTISSSELFLPEPEEDGLTFLENARIKAKTASSLSKLPALGDDSGLVVEDLDGAPGIYSARWAGLNKNFYNAMHLVWEKLGGFEKKFIKDKPKAYFSCALVLAWPDGHTEEFEGFVNGFIVWPPRGENGFGYDPFFIPDGFNKTFGEIDPEEKHAISHRSEAFKNLIDGCFKD